MGDTVKILVTGVISIGVITALFLPGRSNRGGYQGRRPGGQRPARHCHQGLSMPDVNVTISPPTPALQRVKLVQALILTAYTAFMAWQVAKTVCPQLAVREQLLIARIRQYLPHRPRPASQREGDDFVAEVMRYAREQEI